MTNEEKIDRILQELSKLSEQMMLMQAVLLELTKPSTARGTKKMIRTMSVVLEGCEDQTIEPSSPSVAGDGDGDEKQTYGVVGSRSGSEKKRNTNPKKNSE
jgi:hypothetical protein